MSFSRNAMLVAVDTNALDRKSEARSRMVDRFEALVRSGEVTLFLGKGVRAEMAHPAAPDPPPPARADDPGRPLTAAQHIARIRVRAMIQGNAKPGKHEADALHLSEAAEAGCRFFATYDGRILARREDLERYAVPGLKIVTLEELLEAIGPDDLRLSDDPTGRSYRP